MGSEPKKIRLRENEKGIEVVYLFLLTTTAVDTVTTSQRAASGAITASLKARASRPLAHALKVSNRFQQVR